MKNTHSRIGKVKMKSGGAAVTVLNNSSKSRTVNLGWGEVTCREYDGNGLMDRDTFVYHLEAAKNVIMRGNE